MHVLYNQLYNWIHPKQYSERLIFLSYQYTLGGSDTCKFKVWR